MTNFWLRHFRGAHIERLLRDCYFVYYSELQVCHLKALLETYEVFNCDSLEHS